MQNIPFQIFAWVANLFYSFEVIGTKLLSKYEIKNPWLMNFGYTGIVLVFTVPLALYFHAGIPSIWGNLLGAGLFWAIANLLYIFALYKFDVTTLSPLFNLRMAITLILGMFLLGERLSTAQFVFIALMFIGGMLVTLDEKMSWRYFLNWKVLLIAVLMLLSFSIDAVFIKKAIAENGFWTASLWMPLIAQVLFCFTIPLFKSDIKLINNKQGWFILLVGILDLAGTLAVNKAYEKNVSISSAIITLPLSAIIVFILSFIAPKLLEKHPAKVYIARLVGTALIVWAGIKLS